MARPAAIPQERLHFLEEQRRHRRTSVVSAALAVVVALSVLGAAAVLYALGWLLHQVLVAFPRWVAGLWSS